MANKDHSSHVESDHMEQPSSHIVLRLARNTFARSADSWHVLSLSDCDAFRELDQISRSGKLKKVARQKRKSVAIQKPTKPRNIGHGRRMGQISTDATYLLNSITVGECSGLADLENKDSGQKEFKHRDVVAANCCNSCTSVSARRHGKVARRSRAAQLSGSGSCALTEKFLEPGDSGNTSIRDGALLTAYMVNIAALHSDNINFSDAVSADSVTLIKHEDDCYQDMGSNCHILPGRNGAFGVTKTKTCKRKKVGSKGQSTKCRHIVDNGLSEIEDKESDKETAKIMPGVEIVAESAASNTQIVRNSMLLSRRSRPVKNSRLLNNCYVFSPTVKSTRRRKNAVKKWPATEHVVNPESADVESCEAGSSQVISDGVNATDHFRPVDKMAHRRKNTSKTRLPTERVANRKCTVMESSEAGINDGINATDVQEISLPENVEASKLERFTESVSNGISSIDYCGMKDSVTVTDTKDELNHVSEITNTSCSVAEHTSPSSASNLCLSNPLDDFRKDNTQYDMCNMHSPATNVLNTASDNEYFLREGSDFKLTGVEETCCLVAVDKNELQNYTVAEEDILTLESCGLQGDGMRLYMTDDSAKSSQLLSLPENVTCDLDGLSKNGDTAAITDFVETLTKESVSNCIFDVDYCRVDNSVVVAKNVTSEFDELNKNGDTTMIADIIETFEIESVFNGMFNIDYCRADDSKDVAENVTSEFGGLSKNSDTAVIADFVETLKTESVSGGIFGVSCCGADDSKDAGEVRYSCDAEQNDEWSCCSPSVAENATNRDCYVLAMDAATDSEASKLESFTESDCLFPDIAAFTNVDDTVTNSATVMLDFVAVDGDIQNLADDTSAFVSHGANNSNFPNESFTLACAETGEILAILTLDKHGNISDATASTCCLGPEPNSVTTHDVELDMNVSENSHIYSPTLASNFSITIDECSKSCDVVTTTVSDIQTVNPSIYPSAVSSGITSESSLPLKAAPSTECHRRHSHKYHQARRKHGERDISRRSSSESCAELSNDRVVCNEDESERHMTFDNPHLREEVHHRVAQRSDHVHKVKQKFSGSDKVDEIHTDVKAGSGDTAVKTSHDGSPKPSCYSVGGNDATDRKLARRSQHASRRTSPKHVSDQLSSICAKIKRSLSVDHMDLYKLSCKACSLAALNNMVMGVRRLLACGQPIGSGMNEDIGSCLVAMSSLDKLPVTSQLLAKNADILVTIKKCRKFKGSEAVRRQAGVIYNKFKSLFQQSSDAGNGDAQSANDKHSNNTSKLASLRSDSHHEVDRPCVSVSDSSIETESSKDRITSEPVIARHYTSEDNGHLSTNDHLSKSQTVFSNEKANDSSGSPAIVKDDDILEVHSSASPVSVGEDTSEQAVDKLTELNLDKTESYDSDANNFTINERSLHQLDDNLVASSVDMEPAEIEKLNYDDNDAIHYSPRQSSSVLGGSRLPTLAESAAYPFDESGLGHGTDKGHSSKVVASRRQRKISAKRCELYRRLLSSEDSMKTSDVDCDIFDLQSLSSSSDDDDDATDLNLDSNSDHSYLNPSDSELEDRITQIIAEEDEEIIRQHCSNYFSPPTATAAVWKSAARPVTVDKTDKGLTLNCNTSDIDDDELHQLLGVD